MSDNYNKNSAPPNFPFPTPNPRVPLTWQPPPSPLTTPPMAADAKLRLPTAPSTMYDGIHLWQGMLAGFITGVVEHTAMFPVDTLKTRMQAGAPPCHPPLGLRHSLRSLLSAEGPRALYRGIGAMGLGAGPAHAVQYSVYELSKLALSRDNSTNTAAHAASGVLAAIANDTVFNPMDTVKQRLQLRSSPYRGVTDCIMRVMREEGFRAFYASYRTTVAMNATFNAIQFATYEAAKRGLMEVLPDSVSNNRLVVHGIAGAGAGALAAVLTTPLDVVKTQLQCQGVCGCDRFASSSTRGVLGAIIERDGYSGLMRGWKPRMLFHAPAVAISWATYEASKSFFQRLNDKEEVR